MLIYLAELESRESCRFLSQVDDILNPPHTLDSHYVALPSAYSQFHSLWPPWENGIVFPCPYHDACVLRMSLLYFAFEVQSDGR